VQLVVARQPAALGVEHQAGVVHLARHRAAHRQGATDQGDAGLARQLHQKGLQRPLAIGLGDGQRCTSSGPSAKRSVRALA
jgi:hypothetical protein